MRYRRVASAIVGLVLVVGLTTAALSAQGSGENPIVAVLQGIQARLSDLVTAVNNLNTPEGNVLITPGFTVDPLAGALVCAATNVSDGARTVEVQLIDLLKSEVVSSETHVLQPNQLISFLGQAPALLCKFTVVNGVKSDIRGRIGVTPDGSFTIRDPLLAQ